MSPNLPNIPSPRLLRAENPPKLHERYTRQPAVEDEIRNCLRLSETELATRLKVTNFRAPEFVKAETLVCLLGLARVENSLRIENLIAAKLAEICDNLGRRFLRSKGLSDNFTEEAVGAATFEMLMQILERNEKSYDFWEVNFYTALQRLLHNYRRKHARESYSTATFSELSDSAGEFETDFENTLPSRETFTVEKKIGVTQILAKMTDEQRRIFIYYYVDSWTQPQIAEVFGVTARTVRNRLSDIDKFLQKFRGVNK